MTTAIEAGDSCPICLDELDQNDSVIFHAQQHPIHTACLRQTTREKIQKLLIDWIYRATDFIFTPSIDGSPDRELCIKKRCLEYQQYLFSKEIPLHLRDMDLFAEIDILNGIEEFYAFFHRLLERFASRDQSHSTTPLVDHCCFGSVCKIVFSGSSA